MSLLCRGACFARFGCGKRISCFRSRLLVRAYRFRTLYPEDYAVIAQDSGFNGILSWT